MLVELSVFGKI